MDGVLLQCLQLWALYLDQYWIGELFKLSIDSETCVWEIKAAQAQLCNMHGTHLYTQIPGWDPGGMGV